MCQHWLFCLQTHCLCTQFSRCNELLTYCTLCWVPRNNQNLIKSHAHRTTPYATHWSLNWHTLLLNKHGVSDSTELSILMLLLRGWAQRVYSCYIFVGPWSQFWPHLHFEGQGGFLRMCRMTYRLWETLVIGFWDVNVILCQYLSPFWHFVAIDQFTSPANLTWWCWVKTGKNAERNIV